MQHTLAIRLRDSVPSAVEDLAGQDKTNCANFRGSPLFRSYVQHKNQQTINSLFFCQLDAWILAEGEGPLLKYVSLVSFSFR